MRNTLGRELQRGRRAQGRPRLFMRNGRVRIAAPLPTDTGETPLGIIRLESDRVVLERRFAAITFGASPREAFGAFTFLHGEGAFDFVADGDLPVRRISWRTGTWDDTWRAELGSFRDVGPFGAFGGGSFVYPGIGATVSAKDLASGEERFLLERSATGMHAFAADACQAVWATDTLNGTKRRLLRAPLH
jgi:hypothetical protein